METWTDERALYIWSGGVKADLAPVKAAKLALEVTEIVRPFGVSTLGELPDLFTRVLAIGTRPPFLCDYALVSERTSPEGYQRALAWVLHIVGDDPKATTIADILGSFWPGVREMSADEIEAARKFAAYQQGTE